MLDKKVALTESSETPAQLTDSQIAVDHKVPMCSKENVDLVNYLVLSQENTMQTHTKVSENLIISQVVKKNYHHEFDSCFFIGTQFNMQKNTSNLNI